MQFHTLRIRRNDGIAARSRSKMVLWSAWVLALLAGINAATDAQTRRGGRGTATAEQPASAKDAPVPFRAGERLPYRVLWSKYSVNAATLEFSVLERREFFGRTAWHFRGLAHTIETTRILYALDDQFDSYSDAAQLTSLQYEAYLHEMGKQQNNSWRLISDDAPVPKGAVAAHVSPGTRDPIGFVYALRAHDWKGSPELRSPVFDGHHLYDVVARLAEPAGHAVVAAGQFTASRIDVRIFERGQELTDTQFSVWLAQDAARTPVLIEAQVPIGSARVELTTRP